MNGPTNIILVDANGNTSYYLYDDENRQTLAIDGRRSVSEGQTQEEWVS